MRINKVHSNQTSFGTKVRMNSELKNLYSAKDGGETLNNYIDELSKNKKKDVLSISCLSDKSQIKKILIDVFEVRRKQVYTGTTLLLPYPDTQTPDCLNLLQIYKKASRNKK